MLESLGVGGEGVLIELVCKVARWRLGAATLATLATFATTGAVIIGVGIGAGVIVPVLILVGVLGGLLSALTYNR